MQGIFIDGRRPKSKKEIREAVAEDPSRVRIEATSMFPGTEFDGTVADLPFGKVVTFVGPDPRVTRNFYGSITRRADRIVVK